MESDMVKFSERTKFEQAAVHVMRVQDEDGERYTDEEYHTSEVNSYPGDEIDNMYKIAAKLERLAQKINALKEYGLI